MPSYTSSPPNPSIPPKPGPIPVPADPFEAWLMQQAIAGHDRMWLQRNRSVLRQRFERDQSPLPLLPPLPEPVPDRYSEV
jgi:hypothetical protein